MNNESINVELIDGEPQFRNFKVDCDIAPKSQSLSGDDIPKGGECVERVNGIVNIDTYEDVDPESVLGRKVTGVLRGIIEVDMDDAWLATQEMYRFEDHQEEAARQEVHEI